MKVLVAGGAGYIGSHMVWLLGQKGVEVVTYDNLSSGHRDAVHHGRFVRGALANRTLLDELFRTERFDAVMHFASSIQVGESVKDPAAYYRNNVVNTLNLLDTMKDHGVGRFIFSSTAAIFGEPQTSPIDEAHPRRPINPYGRSKLMIEEVLGDYDRAYGFKSVCLRYFNAAGAHPEGLLGERHNPETHLIPLVLQVAKGQRSQITVFGEDYDTPDGTCIRDYIHILDLAEAHWLALRHLLDNGESRAYNLGNGNGYSVQDVIETARKVTGHDIPVVCSERRPGDPARLVADATRIRQEFQWAPNYPALETLIAHAWQWLQSARNTA